LTGRARQFHHNNFNFDFGIGGGGKPPALLDGRHGARLHRAATAPHRNDDDGC
jgi:hypothetical protein